MKDTVKIIFFDIDGTSYSHRISNIYETTKLAINTLKNNGYKIGFITGRSISEMKHLPKFYNEFKWDACIYEGGALAYINNRCVYDNPIDSRAVNKILKLANENDMTVRYTTKSGTYFMNKAKQEVKDIFFRLYLMVPCIKCYENENIYNLLVYYNEDINKRKIKDVVHNLEVIDLKDALEICNRDVNKFNAIKHILEYYNYDLDNVMAFGDGYNDIPMISNVKYGIAVGNSCYDLKKVSYDVCDSIHNDGIYNYLKDKLFI